jgi:hypothetical protein
MHLCTGVSEKGVDVLRYVSFAEVGRICRTVFREPMHLCTCVSEKGGEGEAVCSETPSLLSYILRYVSFAKLPCCVARPHGFLPQLDEFYFTTAEKKPRWLKEKTSQGGT